MIPEPAPRHGECGGTTATGWAFSLLLHTTVVVGSILFLQRIQLAPEPDRFTWNVAMVAKDREAASAPAQSPAPSSSRPPENLRSSPSPLPPPPIPKTLRPADEPSPPQPSTPTLSFPEKPSDSGALRASSPASPMPIPKDPVPEAPPITPQTRAPATPPAPLAQPEPASVPTPAPPVAEQAPALASLPKEAVESPAPQLAAAGTVEAPPASLRSSTAAKPDFGWLSEMITKRVEELKRYPAEARLEQAQGKVIVKVVINEDGSIDSAEIVKSSGFRSLDQAALELMRRAAPFPMSRPLGKPSLAVRVPISYAMDHR